MNEGEVMPEFQIPDNWPVWLALLIVGLKTFWAEFKGFFPGAIKEHYSHQARLREDRQEHEQELEEVSVEALAQHAVTAQMQLINVNQRLIDFVTQQIGGRLGEIEDTLDQVRRAMEKQDARGTMVQIEWSRVVETLIRTEKLLQSLEAWIKGNSALEADNP